MSCTSSSTLETIGISIRTRGLFYEEYVIGFSAGYYAYASTRLTLFLLQLLQKDPEFRMTVKRAKRSKYFVAIDWD